MYVLQCWSGGTISVCVYVLCWSGGTISVCVYVLQCWSGGTISVCVCVCVGVVTPQGGTAMPDVVTMDHLQDLKPNR